MILIQSSSSNIADHKFQLEFFSHNNLKKKGAKKSNIEGGGEE